MKRQKKFMLAFSLTVFVVLVLVHGRAVADDVETIAELKQQVEKLQKRLDALESRGQEPPPERQKYLQPEFGGSKGLLEGVQQMQERMDQMFQNSFSHSELGTGVFSGNMNFEYDVNLNETENGYEVTFDMKGLDQDKLDIQIKEHSVTVKGEQSQDDTQKSPERYMRSQSYGSFMKTIPLPIDADTSKAKTEKEGGILVIKLPKKKK
jgi:HSP20 family protein